MILHITTRKDWEQARGQGEYTADSLKSEGFIHCSKPEQVIKVANARFHGREDLLLLVIDSAKVGPEIKWEDMLGEGQFFPHIYGALNLDAVTQVVDFLPGADGSFTLPRV